MAKLLNFKLKAQIILILGKFSFDALMAVQPVLGGFYFVWFMSSCYLILMNVFVTILNDSIADIGEEEEVEFSLNCF